MFVARGYMDDVENKNIYFNQVKYPEGYGKVRTITYAAAA